MIRTDIHRPSVIEPADYQFVAHEYLQINCIGDAKFIQAERLKIKTHMAVTGGTYSGHEHGGNCMVCGSVNAIYNCLFYHAKSNSYLSIGSDCTEKIFRSDFGSKYFRKQVADVREHLAGKQKAQAILADLGWSQAWDLFTADFSQVARIPYEEVTVRDIVSKLVKYGSFASDRQRDLIGSLLARINNRAQVAARKSEQKATEDATAEDVPTGRITVSGTIVSIKEQDSQFGPVTKMLVKTTRGFKLWGTMPSSLKYDVTEKGSVITFTAKVEPSPNDPKFGFFSRPTKASVVNAMAATA